MIQAYYKYRPVSFEALALLAYADGKDRITQQYTADMLCLIATRPQFKPPMLHEVLKPKRAEKTVAFGSRFVDKMIRVFSKGGEK